MRRHQLPGEALKVFQLQAILSRDDEAELVAVFLPALLEGLQVDRIGVRAVGLALLSIASDAVALDVAQVHGTTEFGLARRSTTKRDLTTIRAARSAPSRWPADGGRDATAPERVGWVYHGSCRRASLLSSTPAGEPVETKRCERGPPRDLGAAGLTRKRSSSLPAIVKTPARSSAAQRKRHATDAAGHADLQPLRGTRTTPCGVAANPRADWLGGARRATPFIWPSVSAFSHPLPGSELPPAAHRCAQRCPKGSAGAACAARWRPSRCTKECGSGACPAAVRLLDGIRDGASLTARSRSTWAARCRARQTQRWVRSSGCRTMPGSCC